MDFGSYGEKPIRVLLIDRDRGEYTLIGQLLSSLGHDAYELTWCWQTEHAIEAIFSDLHDVVLLDYQSDPAAGQAILAKAVQMNCPVPIIVMTAEMDRNVDREAIRSGASDYLLKGRIDSQVLERTLRYAIERKIAEVKLARLAHYDPLTNVPNRILFRDRLSRVLERARRGQQTVALFFIDLDGFKQVNDTLGHEAGDELIRTVAERLSHCMRKSDSVARIGGDEFTVILEDVDTTSDIVNVARKAIDVISRPVMLGGQQVFVGASIGIAVFPEAGEDVDSLAQACRHGDVPGQGPARQRLPLLHREDERRGDEPDVPRGRPAARAAPRRVRAVLPAAHRARRASRSPASRRCCAGTTRCAASSRPRTSFRWPRKWG